MSLSQAALRKLTKDEVIALTLEYQAKFDNTLSNINKELSELCNELQKNCIRVVCFKKSKQQVAGTSGCIREAMLGE